ncbi:MAG: hypothetical protein R2725_04835 [Solirubrobacterales bacterium]
MRPKVPMDLSLAPVAAEIDSNLQRLRAKTDAAAIEAELELELDRPAKGTSRAERLAQVRELALRNVDLHGWEAAISEDASRVCLAGGSVSLDVGLSAAILRYIEDGA